MPSSCARSTAVRSSSHSPPSSPAHPRGARPARFRRLCARFPVPQVRPRRGPGRRARLERCAPPGGPGAPVVRAFGYWREPDPAPHCPTSAGAATSGGDASDAAGITLALENEHECNVATAVEARAALDACRLVAAAPHLGPGQRRDARPGCVDRARRPRHDRRSHRARPPEGRQPGGGVDADRRRHRRLPGAARLSRAGGLRRLSLVRDALSARRQRRARDAGLHRGAALVARPRELA